MLATFTHARMREMNGGPDNLYGSMRIHWLGRTVPGPSDLVSLFCNPIEICMLIGLVGDTFGFTLSCEDVMKSTKCECTLFLRQHYLVQVLRVHLSPKAPPVVQILRRSTC